MPVQVTDTLVNFTDATDLEIVIFFKARIQSQKI